jgi:uncharacterized membrane protein
VYTTKRRSVVKAVTWMTLSTLTGFILIYVLTNELTTALSFAGINFVLKTVLYYLHERGWDVFIWGKITKEEL